MINMVQRDSVGNADAAFIFLPEDDVWWFLVDPNAKAFQFIFNNSLVRQWLIDVQNDEYQMTCFGDGDDLSSSTFAVLCSLDDTWKIQHLDCRSIIHDLTGDRGQGGELIRRDYFRFNILANIDGSDGAVLTYPPRIVP